MIRGPWAIGGDWNCTPEELESTGWLKIIGGKIVVASQPTCGDRELDFCVVSDALEHAAEVACVIIDASFKAHSPVRLYIEANARHAVVRELKVPKGFGAILPHGPAAKPMATDRALNGTDTELVRDRLEYVWLIRQIESELCAVESLDGKGAAQRSGREAGSGVCGKIVDLVTN